MKKNTTFIVTSAGIILAIATLIFTLNKDEKPAPLPSETPIVSEPTEDIDDNDEIEEVSIADYFLYKENTIYKYISLNDQSPTDSMYNQEHFLIHRDGDVSQVKIVIPSENIEYVEVIELNEDYAKLLYTNSSNSKYNHTNFINNLPTEDSSLIMEGPLSVGANWPVDDTSVAEITNLNIEVEVPFGKFNAIEVATNHENGDYTKKYYVKDLGLIKTITSSIETGEHISVLNSIEENSELESTNMTLYAYDVVMDNVIIAEEPITLGYEPNYELILENMLKTVKSENYMALLTPNTTINSATLTYDDVNDTTADISSVVLDLSRDFIDELNVGASIEQTIIECLVATVGEYYGVAYVTILIDGQAFEDGHIQFGEKMPVN